jgi:hypothetical protein
MNALIDEFEEECNSWDYLVPESSAVETDLIDSLIFGFVFAYPKRLPSPYNLGKAILVDSECNLTRDFAMELEGTPLPFEDSAILTEPQGGVGLRAYDDEIDLSEPRRVEDSETEVQFARGMSIIALANGIHRDSRRMEPWERRVASKAFWDEFE